MGETDERYEYINSFNGSNFAEKWKSFNRYHLHLLNKMVNLECLLEEKSIRTDAIDRIIAEGLFNNRNNYYSLSERAYRLITIKKMSLKTLLKLPRIIDILSSTLADETLSTDRRSAACAANNLHNNFLAACRNRDPKRYRKIISCDRDLKVALRVYLEDIRDTIEEFMAQYEKARKYKYLEEATRLTYVNMENELRNKRQIYVIYSNLKKGYKLTKIMDRTSMQLKKFIKYFDLAAQKEFKR